MKKDNLYSLMNDDEKFSTLKSTSKEFFEIFVFKYIIPSYNFIKPLIDKDSYDPLMLDKILNDKFINKFLKQINQVLCKIFKIYTDNKHKMALNEFVKFLTDFEIFPDLIHKGKVIHLFLNFVKDFDKIYVIEGNPKFAIDFDSFIEVLIFIALNSIISSDSDSGNDLDLYKKILHFFQRMAQSKGVKIIVTLTGSAK
jgi:hypothetical protein